MSSAFADALAAPRPADWAPPSRPVSLDLARSSSLGGSSGSVLKTLGASLRGVLPRGLRRYLDGGELAGGGSGWAPAWAVWGKRAEHAGCQPLRMLPCGLQIWLRGGGYPAHDLLRRRVPARQPSLKATARPPTHPPRPTAGATPEGSEAGEGAGLPGLADDDRALIRQELFLGHLLTLAASTGVVSSNACPPACPPACLPARPPARPPAGKFALLTALPSLLSVPPPPPPP